jgi:hypothetical protein
MNSNSVFESMDIIKMEDHIIVNPGILTGKSQEEIDRILSDPTNQIERYGWGEIKILQKGKDYHIVSEFYGKSIKETLDIFYNIYEHSYEILKRSKRE